MPNMTHRLVLRGAAAAVAAGLLLIGADAVAQVGQEELSRETARLISDAIASRIEESVSVPAATNGEEADRRRMGFWGTASHTTLVDDDLVVAGAIIDFDLDIIQTNLGVDRRWDDFYLGVTATGAHAEFDGSASIGGGITGTVDGTADGAAITPYGAWLFNDNIFVVGLAQFGGAFFDGRVTGAGSDLSGSFFGTALTTEVDLNGIFSHENWRFSGKAGHRFTLIGLPLSDREVISFTVHTLLLGGKASYQIGDWQPYAQAQFEEVLPEVGPSLEFLFVRPGVLWQANDRLTFGVEGNVEVVNRFTNSYGGQANFRWIF